MHRERSAFVLSYLRKAGVKLHVLRMNACGEPAHPLYLPGILKPIAWNAVR